MPKVQESKILKFCLLGQCNCPNPSAISRDEVALWEKQGIITYLGETDDVRPFIESASCVVLPSFREGVSVSLLESMAMGKPIITSNVSGCRHLVKDFANAYPNGFLCESRDALSLANAMQKFIALDTSQREKMGQNARKLACESYSIQRIIDIYHKTCVSLLPRE